MGAGAGRMRGDVLTDLVETARNSVVVAVSNMGHPKMKAYLKAIGSPSDSRVLKIVGKCSQGYIPSGALQRLVPCVAAGPLNR
jgi:hypothetical protein